MKTICPNCGMKLEIYSIAEDNVAAVCKSCGSVYDIMLVSGSSYKAGRNYDRHSVRLSREWIKTDEGKEWLRDSLKEDRGLSNACRDVGVTRQTLYRWIKDNEELRKIYKEVKGHDL